MTSLLKGFYAKTKKLADGSEKTYHYDRETGARIQGKPGTSEFERNLEQARRQGARAKGEGTAPKTKSKSCWDAIVAEYKAAPNFKNLSEFTKRTYTRQLERARKFGPGEITDLRRRDVLIIRNQLSDTPGEANNFVITVQSVIAYAIEMEYIEISPLGRIERLAIGTYEMFTEEQVEFALKTLCEAHRRAIILALYTGQREADCIKMTWGKDVGDGLLVKQQKTKKNPKATELWIPKHPVLEQELAAWRAERTGGEAEIKRQPILLSERGRPYKNAAAFSHSITHTLRRYSEFDSGDPDKRDAVFHGLRKLAAVRLCEVGCPPHEIQAITGHASLAMIELYTRQANQKRLAKKAMLRLVEGGKVGSAN